MFIKRTSKIGWIKLYANAIEFIVFLRLWSCRWFLQSKILEYPEVYLTELPRILAHNTYYLIRLVLYLKLSSYFSIRIKNNKSRVDIIRKRFNKIDLNRNGIAFTEWFYISFCEEYLLTVGSISYFVHSDIMDTKILNKEVSTPVLISDSLIRLLESLLPQLQECILDRSPCFNIHCKYNHLSDSFIDFFHKELELTVIICSYLDHFIQFFVSRYFNVDKISPIL